MSDTLAKLIASLLMQNRLSIFEITMNEKVVFALLYTTVSVFILHLRLMGIKHLLLNSMLLRKEQF